MMIRCSSCFEEYDEALGLCPFCGYSEGEQAEEAFCLTPGTIIANRYVIGKMLGLGGFGITYKAWDKKLNSTLAIKEYYPSGLVNRLPGETNVLLVASKREREFIYGKTRFLEEARNMAKFNTHKNIVNVFDFFEANNTAYIVMEFLDGRTLGQVLQQQNVPLPYDYCINVASDICSALRSIHKEGILHRDISPDNIMICNNGTVKLFDFGAARFSEGIENRITVVVKPGFAPPEQYDKVNRQDPRTDIYALGATMYYALTGTKPEESTNRKISDTLVEPAAIDSTIPQFISVAVMRAMAIEPQYRFANVDEFEKTLLNERRVRAVAQEKARRKRNRVLGIVACLLVITAAALAFTMRWNEEKKAATLPDAEFDMLYLLDILDEDTEKSTALQSIIDNFMAEYSNVTIHLDDLAAENNSVGGGTASGAIFESIGVFSDSSNSCADLTEILDSSKENSWIREELNIKTQYPTGIICPAIYVNTTIGALETTKSLQEILDACMAINEYFVVDEESTGMYIALYGEGISDYSVSGAKDEFLAGQAFVYFGNTSDYFDVQQAMPGEYSIQFPECEASTYQYGSRWSINGIDGDALESATAFLQYLNSSLAQDYIHIQNRSNELPIMKDSMENFLVVYDEFAPAADFLSKPFVIPAENAVPDDPDRSALDELKRAKSSNTFEDVSPDDWYADAIARLSSENLMDAVTDNYFEPDSPATRLDAIITLHRLAGSPDVNGDVPFEDVDFTTESGMAVAWAYENGIVTGSADGLFNGSGALNLQATLVFFYRYANLAGMDTSSNIQLEQFTDADAIGGFAIDSVSWAIDHSIIGVQDGGNISPQSSVSRGRFAVLFSRLMDQ